MGVRLRRLSPTMAFQQHPPFIVDQNPTGVTQTTGPSQMGAYQTAGSASRNAITGAGTGGAATGGANSTDGDDGGSDGRGDDRDQHRRGSDGWRDDGDEHRWSGEPGDTNDRRSDNRFWNRWCSDSVEHGYRQLRCRWWRRCGLGGAGGDGAAGGNGGVLCWQRDRWRWRCCHTDTGRCAGGNASLSADSGRGGSGGEGGNGGKASAGEGGNSGSAGNNKLSADASGGRVSQDAKVVLRSAWLLLARRTTTRPAAVIPAAVMSRPYLRRVYEQRRCRDECGQPTESGNGRAATSAAVA